MCVESVEDVARSIRGVTTTMELPTLTIDSDTPATSYHCCAKLRAHLGKYGSQTSWLRSCLSSS